MIRINHVKTIGVIIAISVSMVALGPITFGTQTAQAQGPTRDTVGGLVFGQIVCPNGMRFGADMTFLAQEEPNGNVGGNFEISAQLGPKLGIITDMHVTPSRFSVQGTETFDEACRDFGGGIATTVSIKGKCDDSAKVEFTAANGQRGTFIGQVACVRVSN